MPVICEVADANGVRAERPLALSAAAGQFAITSSPVSAATAAKVDPLAPPGFRITDIRTFTVPASNTAIVVGTFVMNRRGRGLEDDPEFRRRLAAGGIETNGRDAEAAAIARTLANAGRALRADGPGPAAVPG